MKASARSFDKNAGRHILGETNRTPFCRSTQNNETHHPITLIDLCLDVFNGARYFTVMDILFAYHQVEVEPDSVEETAFVFLFGQ
jgi:hypothetical protein